MGASFRNLGEIMELAGCDLLTISPNLLKELESSDAPLTRRLDPTAAAASAETPIAMDKATFDRMHQEDRMASDKLAEGIQGFTKALENTEALLARRLRQLEGGTAIAESTHQLFSLYDLNGDGIISREEWLGADAIFDVMDDDHDGLISLHELQQGLGAVIHLAAS